MSRALLWTAAIGLGGGFACLAIAYAVGGRDLERAFGHRHFFMEACNTRGGVMTERRLPWKGDDHIEIALATAVHLRSNEGSDVVVRGAPGIMEHVELSGSRLSLDCRWPSTLGNIEISVPRQALRRVGVSGSATVTLDELSQPDLNIAVSGSGAVRAHGSIDRLAVIVTGSGKARLADLAARQVTVKVSGSGNVEAAPSDEADVNISGSGNVLLASRPARLSTHISGSGHLRQQPIEAADGRK